MSICNVLRITYLCIYSNLLIISYSYIIYNNNYNKLNNFFYKYMKINSNSNNNNIDSIDNYSNSNNGKNIEEESSSLWRDKVEYVDISSSINTIETTKNSRSLPLFLLGNFI